jgi:hypothetical protein
MAGSTVHPTNIGQSGSSTGAKLQFDKVGTRYDYFVCVPVLGNYILTTRTSITVNTGSYALHLEANGATLGTVAMKAVTVSGTWGIDTAAQPVSLLAGPQIITLVVDAQGTAPTQFVGDWLELTKQ